MFQGSGNTTAATAKRHRLLQQQRVAGLISRVESGRGSGSDHQDRMLNEEGRRRYSHQTLLSNLQTFFHGLEHDRELFAELLLSFRHRLDAVVAAAGGVAATRISNL